jgi:hypothetical protein
MSGRTDERIETMTQLDTALLTLEQAKKKWCPEARSHGTENEAPVNRIDGSAFDNSMCLGNRCAFWRWHDQGERHQANLATVKAKRVSDAPEALSHLLTDDDMTWGGKPDDGRDWHLDEDEGNWYVPAPSLPPRGYCGKAGHPHQAALIEMQTELLQHQLYDARRA